MEDCRGTTTPMEVKSTGPNTDSKRSITEIKPYRKLIGCLMYVMFNTRPDLSASVNYYSRFQNDATEEH